LFSKYEELVADYRSIESNLRFNTEELLEAVTSTVDPLKKIFSDEGYLLKPSYTSGEMREFLGAAKTIKTIVKNIGDEYDHSMAEMLVEAANRDNWSTVARFAGLDTSGFAARGDADSISLASAFANAFDSDDYRTLSL